MTEINLLRPVVEKEAEEAKKRSKKNLLIFLLVAAVVVICGTVFASRYFIQKSNSSLQARISSLESELKDTEAIKENLRTLNADWSKINTAVKSFVSWSSLIQKIAAATPAEVMITKIDYSGQATSSSASSSGGTKTSATTKKEIKIYGETKNRRAVALFQDKLQKESGFFSEANIISVDNTESSQDGGAVNETINFELSIVLK